VASFAFGGTSEGPWRVNRRLKIKSPSLELEGWRIGDCGYGTQKKRKLESTGWKVGSTQDFLGLSDGEMAYIDFKLALSRKLKAVRSEKKMPQKELAEVVRTSQSRVANMEKSSPTVTVDLLLRSLFKLGVTQKELAEYLG
jgi:DNA-binding XRE family transcriptional regulator